MSRRGKRKQKKEEQDITENELAEMQKINFKFVENDWTGQFDNFRDVPVMKALTYDLVQVVNNLGLLELIEEREQK